MIAIDPPVSKSRAIVGFTVLAYTDVPNGGVGYVGASVRLHYADSTYEDTSYTLWSGDDTPAVLDAEGNVVTPAIENPYKYAAAGQWTDDSAQARIAAIIAAA